MNTNKYAVSIILPCYNVSQYIERAIDSILIQDFKDYEIIIINDGSTDNLLQKCDDLGYTEKGYIKILSFKNQGLSQARNEGLKIAQGEYVYFFDPDDYINQGMLSKVYLKAKEGIMMQYILVSKLFMKIKEVYIMTKLNHHTYIRQMTK